MQGASYLCRPFAPTFRLGFVRCGLAILAILTTAHVPTAEAGSRDYPNNCAQRGSAYFCDYSARTEPWVCRLNAIEGSGEDVERCLDDLLAAYNAYAQAHPELFGGLRYTRGTACGTPSYTGIVREGKPWLSSFATSCGVQPYYPDGRPWLWGQSIASVSMGFACPEGWHTYGSGPDGNALDPVCLTLLFPKNAGQGGVCAVGNPVNPATGNKYQVEVDYLGGGAAAGLAIERHYNSSGSGAQIGIGEHWRLGFDRSLGVDEAALAVNARRADGRIYLFRGTTSGYVGDPDVNDRLSALRDAAGTLTAWEYRAADTDELERYDASGRLLSVTSRAGLLWSFEYSDATTPPEVAPGPALLTRVVAPSGRSLRLTYDGLGRVVSIEDPGGALHRYAYDAAGNLATVTRPDGTLRAYRYEHPRFLHALTGIVDENGQRFATFVYDDAGRALLTEHAGGAQRHAIAYSPTSTSSASVTDPLGTVRGYEFTQTQRLYRLAKLSQPCAACGQSAQSTVYDARGNVTARTDFRGVRTTYSWDPARNLELSRTEAAGTPEARTLATEWHPEFRLPVRISEPGRVTTLAYDDTTGNLLSRTVTDPASGAERTWRYTYTTEADGTLPGLLKNEDGPRTDVADVTTYAYAANGDLQAITNALGQLTRITAHDLHGRPLSVVDANGLVTTLAYDSRGRLLARDVGGEVTTYAYDAVGNLTRVTLPDGSFLDYGYDAAHRLTGIADSLGHRIAYTLDAMGNRVHEDVLDPTGALARTRARVFDPLNRLAREIGAAGQSTSYAYDPQGNLTAATDALSRVTTHTYDALNRRVRVSDPAGGETRYGYDALDQLRQVTDPRGLATAYTRDGLGDLAQLASPDTGTTANTNDAAGNLLTQTDAKGQTTTYAYDALNRVVSVRYADGSGVNYLYDQGPHGVGRLTAIVETGSAQQLLRRTDYAYDAHGRVLSETRTLGGIAHVTQYGYDGAGRLVSLAYPSGREVHYGLDALGRIAAVSTTWEGVTQVLAYDIRYRPFGGLESLRFGNGESYGRSFDTDGRITAHTLGAQTRALTWDAASRISAIDNPADPLQGKRFGHDLLDRLTGYSSPSVSQGFTYDAVGNRLTQSVDGNLDAYAYEAASNRLRSITSGEGAFRSFQHDPNGSVTGNAVNAFGYDARGRMVSATTRIGVVDYELNALGQRVAKHAPGGTTLYHYDGAGRLIAETDATGGRREYVWAESLPLAVIDTAPARAHCPAAPASADGAVFTPNGSLERLEVRSGRPGARDWEWGLGVNTQSPGQFSAAHLNWKNAKPYGWTLAYDGAGAATVTVRDGETVLFSRAWPAGMDPGNALHVVVKSSAGIGAGNRIRVTVEAINATPIARNLETAGDDLNSEVAALFASTELQAGFSASGTVTLHFSGPHPPTGSGLSFLATAGTIVCATQAPPPTTAFIHTDHLDTPRLMTDEKGSAIWHWEGLPFGETPPDADPDADGKRATLNLRFPGQYFDAETNLHYNYFRDYDPSTGRYVQSDPIGLIGGINTYAYAQLDPLANSDPFGLMGQSGGAVRSMPPNPPPASTEQDRNRWIGFGFQMSSCGAEGGVVFPNSFTFGGVTWSFERACRYHDCCYARGGGARADCDYTFYELMRMECDKIPPSKGWNARSVCRARALDYFIAVRMFARPHYTPQGGTCPQGCPTR